MSDDRRSDADDRARFTTRTFLLPEDDEPGDGAEGPPEAFGTGDIDDDALDAVVQGTAPVDAPAFVWADTVAPEPVPASADEFLTTPPPPPDAEPAVEHDTPQTISLDEFAPAQGLESDAPVAPDAEDADPGPAEPAPVEAPSADLDDDDRISGLLGDADDVLDTPDAEPEGLEADLVAGDAMPTSEPGSVLGFEPVEAATGSDEEPGATAAADADGTDVAAETAAAVPDTGLEAETPATGTPEAEEIPATVAEMEPVEAPVGEDADAPARGVGLESEAPEPPDAPADAVEAPVMAAGLEAGTADVEDATDAVDAAFDVETDPDKSTTTAGADGIEGDLDVTPLGPEDFDRDELRGILRTMLLSRALDEKMLRLLKQGKGFFHIGSAGHEASQTAVAREFEGGRDWFCFYYRDLCTALTVGITPEEVLRAHFAKAADVFGGGRQMPEHWGHPELNVLSTSSSVAAQYVPAVGFALAVKREDEGLEAGGETRAVYASGGEGSTSQGAFHEALNWAAREALPVLFHVQDNKYAISVPVEEQTAGGSIWHLLGGYAGLKRLRYDGTDFFQAAAASRAAMAHIRAGKGPVALHADLVRLFPHSSSDDHRKYREQASIDADAARDPIPRFVARLVEAGVVTEDEVEALRAEIHAEVDRTARAVEAEADPDPAEATTHVYYEGDDDRQYEVPGETGDLVVMVDAINHALDEEMARDDRVLVYGEDVGGGKGGVFTATRGLTEKHGRDRCFNSPLAEHSIIGSAVGLAAAGYKPVVEIQFADYIWPGMQPLRNQVASMRYRSKGTWACPMVLRVPCGGYIHGGLCHSQNVEAIFAHFPGLQVVLPSNAADAKGLLKSAIRGHDPVLFLEHKALYRQGPARRPEPHDDYLVPLGKAAVAREGTDLTIVTWGAIVYKALNAAKALEKDGVSVEVIDVRSILPLDSETILASAKKTGRVLVAYEDHEFMGFGAEIAAQVADAAFGHLDAPVKRVAGAFSSIPYADPLEKAVLPQDDDVLEAARDLLAY